MRHLIIAALVVAGCGTNKCKDGTILLHVTIGDASITTLRVDVDVDGGTPHTSTVPSNGSSGGAIEIDFHSYPAGRTVQIHVAGLAVDGTEVAAADTSFTAEPTCSEASVSLGAASSDLSVVPDLSPCTPTLTSCPATVGCGKIDDGCGNPIDCGPCQVTSVSPSIGAAGDTVTLEGTFSQTVDVDFGGGSTIAGTVLGPHRASVVVGAVGDGFTLSVASGGSTIGTQPFRRASFPLGVGPLRTVFEQESAARSFPVIIGRGRSDFGQAVIGPYYYLVGGNETMGPGSSGPSSRVSRATINADGTISPVNDVPAIALTTARRQAGTVVTGSTLYVIGGTGSTILSSVERATIDAAGNLSSFLTLPASGTDAVTLTQGRYGFATVIIGNYVYVIGGTTSLGIEKSIERATISSSGTLGNFTALPTSGTGGVQLATPRSSAAAIVVGNKLYVVGGTAASGDTNSVDVADVMPDGTVGTFTTLPTSGAGAVALTAAKHDVSLIQIGHVVYAVGGLAGTTPAPTIESATVDGTGALGTFAATATPLGTGRGGVGLLVAGNRLYVVGGSTGGLDSDVTLIETAALDASGAVSTFAALPTTGAASFALPAPRMSYGAVTLGPYVYLIGGYEGSALVGTVLRASLQPDGSLSPFVQMPTTGASAVVLTGPRQRFGLAVIGGYLYVIGGDAGGNDPVTTVERATINADGTISSFATVAGVTVKNARWDFTTAVVGSFLYLLGGQMGLSNAGTTLNSIEIATINSDDTIGTFALASQTLATARSTHASVALGGYLYAIGGKYNNGSIDRAPISSGSLGTFTALPTSGTTGVTQAAPRGYYSLNATGPTLLGVGGIAAALVSSIDSATVASDGTISTFVSLPTSGAGAVTLSPAADAGTSLVLGNRIWWFGGNGNNGLLSVVQTATLR